ncbi:MAG: HAD-IA family hydrolase [Bacteroidales bacterium]|nr:HAD-IA family hydrolase [Bacteroidales bacterium]
MKLSTKALIFDWGNTIMEDDSSEKGPMYQWKEVKLVEGADELLEYISKKYIVCLATNAGESNAQDVKKALKRVDVLQYFDHIYTSKDLGYNKPDPNFFIKMCKDLGLMAYDCTMIGDNYQKDIVGAKQINIRTVFFNRNTIQKGSFPEADFQIGSLKELLELLEL